MKMVVIAGALMGLVVSQGYADDDDHERARALRQQGDVLPLVQLIAQLQRRQPGRVLEAELEHEDGRWLYEIELLTDDGTVWEFKLDAASGELLQQERED